jgi:hypothetical protein
MNTADDECALAEKLLRTFHLSVPERATFSGGRMRLSTLVTAAERYLASGRCLPEGWTPESEFDGVVIELRGDGYWLHERAEVAIMRFSPLFSERADNLREAVRYYLNYYIQCVGGLDGIPIAWDE